MIRPTEVLAYGLLFTGACWPMETRRASRIGWLIISVGIALLIAGCTSTPRLVSVPEVEGLPETCNNADDDLDGRVDDFYDVCPGPAGGFRRCLAGAWSECPIPPGPQPERCNGLDDDGDGAIDEAAELPVEPCYPAPAETLRYGECRFGLTRCVGGVSVCMGAVTPTAETCDGLDDDCDGTVDEGGVSGTTDLVFVVDNSCSMGWAIATVKTAADTFAQKYAGRTDLRWALVAAPAVGGFDKAPRLVLNFTTAGDFATEMAKQDGTSGYGEEPTLDAIDLIADPRNALFLAWAGDRRAVVLLTDEMPQSYAVPTRVTMTDVATKVAGSGLMVHTFTTQDQSVAWSPLGPTHDLAAPAGDLVAELEAAVTASMCGGGRDGGP